MHTLIDLRGTIPTYVTVTTGKVHDVRMLDALPVTEDAIYTMDRAYIDFSRLHTLHQQGAFFVVRAKDNLRFKQLYSAPKDKGTGIRADQAVALVTYKSKNSYPEKLRRVSYVDKESGKRLVFLTNNFTIPALTAAEIYKQRWQVELFFQMGQTALADQVVLRNIDQRCEESDLDCFEHLSTGCDCQEEAQHPMSALHFFTDSGGQFV